MQLQLGQIEILLSYYLFKQMKMPKIIKNLHTRFQNHVNEVGYQLGMEFQDSRLLCFTKRLI